MLPDTSSTKTRDNMMRVPPATPYPACCCRRHKPTREQLVFLLSTVGALSVDAHRSRRRTRFYLYRRKKKCGDDTRLLSR